MCVDQRSPVPLRVDKAFLRLTHSGNLGRVLQWLLAKFEGVEALSHCRGTWRERRCLRDSCRSSSRGWERRQRSSEPGCGRGRRRDVRDSESSHGGASPAGGWGLRKEDSQRGGTAQPEPRGWPGAAAVHTASCAP
eukprot:1661098-Rhodomonas_salina.1